MFFIRNRFVLLVGVIVLCGSISTDNVFAFIDHNMRGQQEAILIAMVTTFAGRVIGRSMLDEGSSFDKGRKYISAGAIAVGILGILYNIKQSNYSSLTLSELRDKKRKMKDDCSWKTLTDKVKMDMKVAKCGPRNDILYRSMLMQYYAILLGMGITFY